MLDDQQLLRRYAADGSEAAFGELVARYVNLVYSVALRRTGGDTHLAQDVAQLVFTDLARKARSLPEGVVLAGWLHRATRYAAAQLLRTERRRVEREQEAVAMNTLETNTTPDWEKIRPLLDEALDELGRNDRDALLLRFFEQRSLAEVGNALGSNEDAARKRVARALEKLRADLVRRGITTTAETLSATISVNAIQVAPVGLAATLSTTAISGITLTAAAATATKAITMTTLQKTLITASIAAAIGTGIYEARRASVARAQAETLQQQQVPLTKQIRLLDQAFTDATNQIAALREDNERLSRNSGELLRLRGLVGSLRRELTAATNQIAASTGAHDNSDKPTPNFQYQYLSRKTWSNVGTQTPMNLLETYMWALATKNEPVLAEVSTKGTNGQPTRLTGLSTDFYNSVAGVQVLSFGARTPDASDWRCTLVAEVPVKNENQNGPFDSLSHMVLNLRFKREDGKWKFDGRSNY